MAKFVNLNLYNSTVAYESDASKQPTAPITSLHIGGNFKGYWFAVLS